MQILLTRTKEQLQSASTLFQQFVEPLLLKLETASRNGHPLGRTRLGQDYLQVCRWPFRQLEYSYVLAAIQERGQPGGKALDAGSGITPFGHTLAAMGFEVWACDYDRQLMTDLAAAGMETVYGSSIVYEWQDLTALRYPDATFDLVTCVSVLEHIGAPSDQSALREMIRVLKPGGQLVMTVDYEPAPARSQLGGRNRRRIAELAKKGDLLAIVRAVMRKVRGRRDVSGGLARHVRTANQSFSLAHLQDDLAPIMGSGRHDVRVPYAVPSESVFAEDVPGFWNLIPGLFEVQGCRVILPAALRYIKP